MGKWSRSFARNQATEPETVSGQDDLSQENPSNGNSGPREKKYSSLPGEDNARRRIAYGILFGIAAMIGAGFFTILRVPDQFERLMEFYKMVFTPVMTLAGSAIGFYYAGRTSK